MKNIIKGFFLSLTILFFSCGDNNTSSSVKSNCTSYDAKQALINNLTEKGLSDYDCVLISGNDQSCDYTFQLNSYDGSKSKLSIIKKNGSWEISYVR